MACDVFISYSHADKAVADAICAELEKGGICCWYAPRDIAPGTDWAESIIEAINSTRVMVLILSARSNDSEQVRREISCAVSARVRLAVYMLEDVPLAKSLQYYLATVPRIDAVNVPERRSLAALSERVRKLMAENGDGGPEKKKKRLWLIVPLALLIAAGIWVSGLLGSGGEDPFPSPDPEEPAVAAEQTEVELSAPEEPSAPEENPAAEEEQAPAEEPAATEEPAPTETPAPTPEPLINPAITEKYGVTDADLERIQGITLLGDRFVFWRYGEKAQPPESLAERIEADGSYDWWIGAERVRTGSYRDLDFLRLMTNLRFLYAAEVSLADMPALSEMKQLDTLWISDCELPGLDWVRDSGISTLTIRRSGLPDLSPLESCRKLETADVDIFTEGACSLEDLAKLPDVVRKSLTRLTIVSDGLYDPDRYTVSAYANSQKRLMAQVRDSRTMKVNVAVQGTLKDLTLLEGMDNLRELTVAAQPVQNLKGIENLKNLEKLELISCLSLKNLAQISGLTKIRELRLDSCTAVSSLNGAGSLAGLEVLSLTGLERLTNLRALSGCDFTHANTETDGFRFICLDMRISDLSPLSGVAVFADLELTPVKGSKWGRALKDSRIISLTLDQAGVQKDLEENLALHPEIVSLTLNRPADGLSLSMLAGNEALRRVTVMNAQDNDGLAHSLGDLGSWTYSGGEVTLTMDRED